MKLKNIPTVKRFVSSASIFVVVGNINRNAHRRYKPFLVYTGIIMKLKPIYILGDKAFITCESVIEIGDSLLSDFICDDKECINAFTDAYNNAMQAENDAMQADAEAEAMAQAEADAAYHAEF